MPISCGLPQKDWHEDVYAIGNMFLRKKSYIDILEYVNDEGHKIHDQHVRMNGFPASCIGYYAKDNNMSVLGVCKETYVYIHMVISILKLI